MPRNKKRRKKNSKKKKEIAKNLPLGYTIHKAYVRFKGKFPPWFIFMNMGNWELNFADGRSIKMWSARYRTFAKDLRCAKCGLKGSYFRLERHALGSRKNNFHFNLYAVNGNGHETLMTKDHIIPKSKGGTNHISNLQTMCTHCNNHKDDKISAE